MERAGLGSAGNIMLDATTAGAVLLLLAALGVGLYYYLTSGPKFELHGCAPAPPTSNPEPVASDLQPSH